MAISLPASLRADAVSRTTNALGTAPALSTEYSKVFRMLGSNNMIVEDNADHSVMPDAGLLVPPGLLGLLILDDAVTVGWEGSTSSVRRQNLEGLEESRKRRLTIQTRKRSRHGSQCLVLCDFLSAWQLRSHHTAVTDDREPAVVTSQTSDCEILFMSDDYIVQ